VKSTAKAVLHRLKQARSAIVKVEATWAGFQFLLALGPLGVLIGLVLWLRRRRHQDEPSPERAAASTSTNSHPPAPQTPTPANTAANGLVN
jgi:hypothetical protein